jgi:hypothetical protein
MLSDILYHLFHLCVYLFYIDLSYIMYNDPWRQNILFYYILCMKMSSSLVTKDFGL